MGTGRWGRLAQATAVLAGCVAVALMAGGWALAADPPEYELRQSFGPEGSSTEFSNLGSLAVDQQDDLVYVIERETGKLHRFDLEGNSVPFSGSAPYISGNEITGLTYFEVEAGNQVAVDSSSHEFYVTSENSVTAFSANGEPAEFSAGPGAGTNVIGGFTRLTGLAVDGNGTIYAADRDAGVVRIFAPSGEELTQFSAPEAGNLAVDSKGSVYVNRQFNQTTVFKYTPSSFPVTAGTTYTAASEPLSPAGSYTVAVDRTTDRVFVAQFGEIRIVIYDEEGEVVTSFAGPGEDGAVERVMGLGIDESSGLVFAADDAISAIQVKVFGERIIPTGPPIIESVSAADVTADSATLLARINPNSVETTYHFEYGPEDCAVSACVSVPLNDAGIGSGSEPVTVSHVIPGLAAETTYHYRVVATNEKGTNLDKETDHTFTTQSTSLLFDLSDARVWEMVSPPNKHGALLFGSASGHIQAAGDGNGLVYRSGGPIDVDPEGNRIAEAASYLATRGASGWGSVDLTPPNDRTVPLALGYQDVYKFFNIDLSEALLEPRSGAPLSPEASERAPYWRQNTEPPLYRPLVTGKEGFANVAQGVEFGNEDILNETRSAVEIQGSTPDLDHVLLRTAVSLAPGAPAPSLYKWSDGDLLPVSVLPETEGGDMVTAVFAGSGPRSVRNAISEDGSRVFWTGLSSGNLYLRDFQAEESVRINLVQPGASGAGDSNPIFQGASTDGTVVFFTDSQQLTEDASPGDRDLYRCVIPAGAPLSGCSSLENISAPLAGSGESADVQGIVSAMSDDGSRAYFVAKGALATGATSGEPNLYLWQEGEDVRFIATLAADDQPNWGITPSAVGNASALSAAASPTGRYFAFMSKQRLTGADNFDAATGEQVERVFLYDAETEALECISCNPTGAAPEGRTIGESLIDPRSLWQGERVEAVLPEPTLLANQGLSIYRPRAVLDNGRVFFNASDSLVPGDSNAQWDVYQYENTGVGDCDASSGNAAVSRSGEGCVSLLSSGTAKREAVFLDASISGDDVFFLTTARLSVHDKDDERDVYDARVGGKLAVLEPSPECLGSTCRPLVPQGVDPAPSSATFNGAGNVRNVKKCPKGKRKVKRGGKIRCISRGKRKGGRR
jgi:hypothetical protein